MLPELVAILHPSNVVHICHGCGHAMPVGEPAPKEFQCCEASSFVAHEGGTDCKHCRAHLERRRKEIRALGERVRKEQLARHREHAAHQQGRATVHHEARSTTADRVAAHEAEQAAVRAAREASKP